MNKLYFPLFSFRYKEMLELVISPSLTVNSDCPGKPKLNRADADVWTLSDIEGRPPGVSFGGPVAVPLAPRNLVKGPTAFDTCPFASPVIMTVSPLAIGIVASEPELWRAVLTVLSSHWRCKCARSCAELPVPRNADTSADTGSFGCVPGPGPGCALQGCPSGSQSVPQRCPAIRHPGGRLVDEGLTGTRTRLPFAFRLG